MTDKLFESQKVDRYLRERIDGCKNDPDVGILFETYYLPLLAKEGVDISALSSKKLYEEYFRADLAVGLLRLIRLGVCGHDGGIFSFEELSIEQRARLIEYSRETCVEVRTWDIDNPPKWLVALYG